MRVLLEYCFDHPSSRRIYGGIAAALRRRGIEATVVQFADGMDLSAYDVLISHDHVEGRGIDESAIRVYGGRDMTRPEQMAVMAAAGVPVMPWALAPNEAAVLDLFGRWQAQRVLLKRSGTFKGRGVTVFDRLHVGALLVWEAERDLFCPELNECDGDVYKIEIFNGRIILGWTSRRAPLARRVDGFAVGLSGAHAPRRLIGYSRELRAAASRLSRNLTDRGIGYASLDLMKTTAGDLVAIELNTVQVATWWTAKFPWMRWRYARAAVDLVAAPR